MGNLGGTQHEESTGPRMHIEEMQLFTKDSAAQHMTITTMTYRYTTINSKRNYKLVIKMSHSMLNCFLRLYLSVCLSVSLYDRLEVP